MVALRVIQSITQDTCGAFRTEHWNCGWKSAELGAEELPLFFLSEEDTLCHTNIIMENQLISEKSTINGHFQWLF